MATGLKSPTVFSIPPGAPFLETLADALLDGRLGTVHRLGEDPLALADVTVLLPTRRAVRTFGEILLSRAPAGALVLPNLRPIGDIDEEEHLLFASAETAADRLLLPDAVSRVERLLVLSRLIGAWSRAIRADLFDVSHDRRVPETAAGAVRLAADLARLIDDMEIAGVAWSELRHLIPEDYPEFRQLTLDFLRIAGEAWPAYLEERGLVNPAGRRDRLLRAEAARLAAHPPSAPIVAAGSTGSIPATAHLLAAIARLPTGAVVLPGLDRELDDESWSAIGGPEEGTVQPSHPQYGLKQLLAALGTTRDGVEELVSPNGFAARRRLLSEAMRPAETTHLWSSRALPDPLAALEGLSVVVARNDREEALAIAFALREAIEDPAVTTALVTPDRDLARRVSAELARWDILADDSAGAGLDTTPPGIFARLLAEVLADPTDPLRLLALLKHPMAAFGMARADCRHATRAVELALFRGKSGPRSIASLADALTAVRGMEHRRRDPPARLTAADWEAAGRLARRLATVFAPFENDAAATSLASLLGLFLPALRAAATDDLGSDAYLWQGTGGEALARLLAELGQSGGELEVSRADLPSFLSALMAGVRVSKPPMAGARIHIWGVLEARLQSADLMILAGLDEGVWPAETRTDPWLSRTMRAQLGLEPPERRIGLAAHDFAAALAGRRVIVTRAERRAGTPTIPSRWLQRLFAVIGEDTSGELTARGSRFLSWARHADTAASIQPTPRPAPRPPVAHRPRALSITEIETWIRDPYAIYARHVLGVHALPEIGEPPDAAMRGIILHAILGDFVLKVPGDGMSREQHLLDLARTHFAPLAARPDLHALWWLRWEDIARWFLSWEANRESAIASRHAEISGSLEFEARGGAFTVRGRADRIDQRFDGALEIYDFKSGQTPSPAQVALFAPQLPLEAAMVTAGGFGEMFKEKPVAELAFIGLAGISRDEWLRSAVGKDTTPGELAAATLARLKALVAAYDTPEQGYISMARPMFERRWVGDYDHLARIGEWRHSLGEGA
jgi:ATP-dependent helicase/nuclease subunit B